MLVKNDYINSASMVIENMLSTRKILGKSKYGVCSRMRRESFPYACHLACMFEHFKMSFEEYLKESMKSSWFVKK